MVNTFLHGNFFYMYMNLGGGGYSHTLPIKVFAAQRDRDFEVYDL